MESYNLTRVFTIRIQGKFGSMSNSEAKFEIVKIVELGRFVDFSSSGKKRIGSVLSGKCLCSRTFSKSSTK